MSDAAEEKVSKLLKSALYGAKRAAGPCRSVQLRQIIAGTSDRIINDWAIPDDQSALDFDMLLGEIGRYAQEDADAWSGPNRYIVVAFFGDEKSPGATSPPFLLRSGRPDDDADLYESEGPTAGGLQARLMRHNEILMRTLVNSQAQSQGFAEATIRRLSQENAKLQDHALETIEVVQQLHDRRAERDIQVTQAQKKEERQDRLMQSAELLLPTAVNKIAGHKLLPEKTVPALDILFKLLNKIDDKVLIGLAQAIEEPVDRAAFLDLVEMGREQAKAARGDDGTEPQTSSKVVKLR